MSLDIHTDTRLDDPRTDPRTDRIDRLEEERLERDCPLGVPTSLSVLSPESTGWRAFAAEHASSPLQHPAWLDTLTSAYRLRARIVALTDAHGSILAGLPMIRGKLPWRKGWTALPFTDTFEPIAGADAHRDELLRSAAEHARAHDEPILIRAHTPLPGWTSRQVGTVQMLDLATEPRAFCVAPSQRPARTSSWLARPG